MTTEALCAIERLVIAMTEFGCGQAMISKARVGYYDDFKSNLDLPSTALVNDLRDASQLTLMRRAMSGEFDAAQWEAEEWAKSEDGLAAFKEMDITPEEALKKFAL